MKEPTVSVAMATYNGERFLQEQLDSLARQTLLPYELVACDDGSTDGTLDILHRFAANVPFPVRVHRNETRLGYGLNFLRAASLCSGELIAFCDQDDVWLSHKLHRCATAISEMDSNMVIHSARVVDENLRSVGRRAPWVRHVTCLDAGEGRGWRTFARRLGLARGCTCVFRSRLLNQMPPGPPVAGPDIGHEGWLAFASEVTGSVTLLPDEFILYRQHGGNVVGFRARPEGGLRKTFDVGGMEYLRQAEDAAGRARLLGDAAARLPELRPRLTRAQYWYAARAKSLARRAGLYSSGSSFSAVVRSLVPMIFDGTYRAVPRGGLGFKGLGKDFVAQLLRRSMKRPPAEVLGERLAGYSPENQTWRNP